MAEQSRRYFVLSRTQPFIVTLFHAVISLKRMSKVIKRKMLFDKKMALEVFNSRSSLRKTILLTDHEVFKAREGQTIITNIDIDIEAKQQKYDYYNDPTVIRFFDNRARMKTMGMKKRGKGPTNITILASRQIQKHRRGLQTKEVSEILMKRLRVKPLIQENELSEKDSTNQVLPKEKVRKNQYLAGTNIYYGSIVALQAKHGGFMSFFDKNNLIASAHKILPTSSYTIMNVSSFGDSGIVRYGDSIWFHTGQESVLGAQFLATGNENDRKRVIHPALISSKKTDMLKAQQYGRWIILNREDPVKTIGESVGHRDKILLEQEWYFLSSISPYVSGMYKTKADLDSASRATKELFNPGFECTWILHLHNQPAIANHGEKTRSMTLARAKEAMDQSKQNRFDSSTPLFAPLKTKIKQSLHPDEVVQDKLHYLLDNDSLQEHFVSKFSSLSAKNFATSETTTEFLQQVYGSNSNIVRFHEDKVLINQHDLNKVESMNSKRIASRKLTILERKENKYWEDAQSVLIDTVLLREMPRSMAKYIGIITTKKNWAVKKIQNFFKKYCRAYSYPKIMQNVDELVYDILSKQEAKQIKKKTPGSIASPLSMINSQRESNFNSDTFLMQQSILNSRIVRVQTTNSKKGLVADDTLPSHIRSSSDQGKYLAKRNFVAVATPAPISDYLLPYKCIRPMTMNTCKRISISESAANIHERKSVGTICTQLRPKTRSIEPKNLLAHPDFGLPDSFFDDETTSLTNFNQPLIHSNATLGLKFLRSINSCQIFSDLGAHKN